MNKNKNSFFITGTNTDVGKTSCAIWLTSKLDMAYYKPIETGSISDYEVAKGSGAKCYEPKFSLPHPASPHLSARLSGVNINLSDFSLPQPTDLIVEGAGGVFVPINENKKIFMIDLIKHFNLPVLIVAKDRLGVLNEVILTKFALDYYKIPILGVVMNKFDKEKNNLDNAKELAKLIDIDVIEVDLTDAEQELPDFLKNL